MTMNPKEKGEMRDLAHLVKTVYLPILRKNIEATEEGNINILLERRYGELDALCTKYNQE